MTQEALTEYLRWKLQLKRVMTGTSSLLRGIELYIDFDWSEIIGHTAVTFSNYLSLGRYIKTTTPPGERKRALVLTIKTAVAEGLILEHDSHDIYVVDILRYKSVAERDAASAYFAGLRGVPTIRIDEIAVENFTKEQIEKILDALGSAESIGKWILRHPDELSGFELSLAELAKLVEAFDLRSREREEPISSEEASQAFKAFRALGKYAICPPEGIGEIGEYSGASIDLAQMIAGVADPGDTVRERDPTPDGGRRR